jgi:hypothetical protein
VADPDNDPSDARPGATASEAPPHVDDDAPVPRIGRGRHRGKWSYYFPPQQVISLFALIIGLIAVLALRDSCSRGAGNFLKAFDAPPDAGAAPVPRP